MSCNVLAILGNGFDLNCGLQSSYKDFFNYQVEHHSNFKMVFEYLKENAIETFSENNIKELLHFLSIENDLTFFDLYFLVNDWKNGLLLTEQIWSSIEDALLSGINTTSDSLSYNLCLSAYSSINTRDYSFFQYNHAEKIMGHFLYKTFKKISEKQYHDYLIKELNRFSESFANYIYNQYKDNSEYLCKADNLLTKITGVALNECKIISFNYTDPFISSNSANIHGVASKKEIVFGIACDKDAKKANSHYGWGYKMSKEYKIALIMSKGQTVSLNYEGIKDIFVYGLSLGEQDYDFFENLFDKFEFLMRSYEAKIHFCYSIYGNKTLDEVAEEATQRVANIINKYGDSHNDHDLLRSLIQNGALDIRQVK